MTYRHKSAWILLLICLIVGPINLFIDRKVLNATINGSRLEPEVAPTLHVNNNSTNDITRILIAGYAHSGTTYISQFIGEVLFGKDSVFYLFEPTHIFQNMHLYQPFYAEKNMSISFGDIQTFALINLFNCTFLIKENRTIHSFRISAAINQLAINNNLTKQCLSKKVLIFKTIHYHSYVSYKYLWKYYPNLIVINLIRNPITHIPSRRRLYYHRNNWTFHAKQICHQQLDGLRYLIDRKHNISSSGHTFNIWKQEEFFQNIQQDLINHIQKLYSLFFNNGNTALDIMPFINRFDNMDIWETKGRLDPVRIPPDQQHITYMLRECKQFMLYFGYNYSA